MQQLFVDEHRSVVTTPTKPWSVAVLEWPEQAEEAESLAAHGALRLLLVKPGEAPPVDWDLSSDWLRRPAEPRDVLARVETLQRRSERESGPAEHGSGWAALARAEVGGAGAGRGSVDGGVDGERSASRAPIGARERRLARREPGGATLDVRLQRLRTRIKPMGLEIASIRQRGYVLTFIEP